LAYKGIHGDGFSPDPDIYAIRQSTNLYAYVINNPILYTDPSGLALPLVIPPVAKWIAGVIAGGAGVGWAANEIGNEIGNSGYFDAPMCEGNNTSAANTTRVSRGELGRIAGRFGNLECDDAARAMRDHLIRHNQHGELLILTFPNAHLGWVVSDTFGANRHVSRSGWHHGILYNGLVHCNVHPNGIPEAAWIDDFHASAPPKLLTRVPF
jgi:hypothetical protein